MVYEQCCVSVTGSHWEGEKHDESGSYTANVKELVEGSLQGHLIKYLSCDL